MTDTPVIELVDSEIIACGADGQLLRDPGFALLNSGGIDTGEAAFNQAWLHPQRSFNQFWHRLNLAPLSGGNRFARHYADLAYAQLNQLHQRLGEPPEILFAIPGSFSRDQLALLLGLANALSVKTLGLVDTAVAATSTLDDSAGELLYLDIQLHQAVATRLRGGDEIVREAVELLPDTGLYHFYNGWAQYIANLFIREYRYDPLHTTAGEQQLFSKLPALLAELAIRPETSLALNTPRGDVRLNLQRSALLESSLSRIDRLRELINRLAVNGPLIASHRLGKLPGVDALLGARLLDERQAVDACRQALATIRTSDVRGGDESGVDFVTRLPRQAMGSTFQPVQQAATRPGATHLLHGHRAWPLGSGLGIEISDGVVRVSRDSSAPLQIRTLDQRTWLDAGSHQVVYQVVVEGDRDNLRSGDLLRVEGCELHLIEIAAEG